MNHAQVTELLSAALTHQASARFADAQACCRQVLNAVPRHPDALHILGLIAIQSGNPAQGAQLIESAIARFPTEPNYHNNLASAYSALGRADAAIASYRRAIEIGNLPDAHANLAAELQQLGRLNEAVAEYRLALAQRNDSVQIHNSLAFALSQLGNLQEAEQHCHQAIALSPDFAPAHVTLGCVMSEYGRNEAAAREFAQAAQLDPANFDAHNDLAVTLQRLGRPAASMIHAKRAMQVRPSSAQAQVSLGVGLLEHHRLSEAMAVFEHALKLDPGCADAAQYRLLASNYADYLSPGELRDLHLEWGRKNAAPFITRQAPAAAPRHQRRLRVGYVSADFRYHSVASFFEPLLRAHDREQFEIICYYNRHTGDAITERMRALAGKWRNVAALSDDQLADAIRVDEVDVLVDLSGHTAENRLRVFARKPAAVQFTMIGYPNTTGLHAIDYRLTDALCDPPGQTDHLYSEQLLRLNRCFLCYNPIDVPVAPRPLRDHIVFGSFNRPAKISPTTLTLWSRILQSVPRSRLLIKGYGLGEEATRHHWLAALTATGIADNRVDLIAPMPSPQEHLRSYQESDIALDTYPFNGTTTTCEAMWMNTPVITLSGTTPASRVGRSLLNAVGLSELVAEDPESYVRIAVGLAENRKRLSELHTSLRQMMRGSELTDARGYANAVERAYLSACMKAG